MTLLQIDAENVDAPVTPEDVSAVISVTEPIEVRLDEVHAGPVRAAAEQMKVKLDRGEPGFAYIEDNDVLLVRLEHRLSCYTEDRGIDLTTDVRAHHIVAFKVHAPLEVSSSVIGAFIETNAYFIAYPYVRQFFTQITAAMGLPPVVLGYMKRDSWPFADSEDETAGAEEANGAFAGEEHDASSTAR